MKRGRFAPSATGALHMGSLTTALASFFSIKKQKGYWSVRIDDLDNSRNQPEAVSMILEALKAHGLNADGKIDYQSDHLSIYDKAVKGLEQNCFACTCTRKSLRNFPIYPGTCRLNKKMIKDSAMRIQVPDIELYFKDQIHGLQQTELAKEIGDFILVRRDKVFSYNLTSACDDGADCITDVVRGADLLKSTANQVFLMHKLNLEVPTYTHVPLVCHPDGTKLSKQTGAKPLDNKNAKQNILTAFAFLGLYRPVETQSISSLIQWGINNWSLKNLPGMFSSYF